MPNSEPCTKAATHRRHAPRRWNRGLVPSYYLQDRYRKSQKAYVRDYLKEEVFDEGLTRKVPAFPRFSDAMGYSHGSSPSVRRRSSSPHHGGSGVAGEPMIDIVTILLGLMLG